MNTNITLLGTAGAGKTNFISKAVRDINSFSPQITIMPEASTQVVSVNSFRNNQYILKAYENIQWKFSICDYEGSLLKSYGNERNELKKIFYSSDAWIVLVDGEYFDLNNSSDGQTIGRIKRNIARIFIPYISDYAVEHDEMMPELLFVVTKAGRLINGLEPERIKHIVMEAFEGIFDEGASPMILLCDTSNTKTAGLAILSIFYIRYEKEILDNISLLENRNRQIDWDVSNLRNLIDEIENQKILGKFPANIRKVERYREQVLELTSESFHNNYKIRQYRRDVGLKHLGTCVQGWIDNNPQLIINGFDNINYQYDKFTAKMGEAICELALRGIKFIRAVINKDLE